MNVRSLSLKAVPVPEHASRVCLCVLCSLLTCSLHQHLLSSTNTCSLQPGTELESNGENSNHLFYFILD